MTDGGKVRPGTGEGGFTLMETVVAVALFSIGILLVGGTAARAFHEAGRQERLAWEVRESAALADSLLREGLPTSGIRPLSSGSLIRWTLSSGAWGSVTLHDGEDRVRFALPVRLPARPPDGHRALDRDRGRGVR